MFVVMLASLSLVTYGVVSVPTAEASRRGGASADNTPVPTQGALLTLNAARGTFKPIDGQAGRYRLTLTPSTAKPRLRAPIPGPDLKASLSPADGAGLINALGGTADAVVRVPGAPQNRDAVAVKLTNLTYDAESGLQANAQVVDRVGHPLLNTERSGLDPKLAPKLGASEVFVAAPPPTDAHASAPTTTTASTPGQGSSAGDKKNWVFDIRGRLPVGNPAHPDYYQFQDPQGKCTADMQTINFPDQFHPNPVGTQDWHGGAFDFTFNVHCLISGASGSWTVNTWHWKKGNPVTGYYPTDQFNVVFNPVTLGVMATGCRPARRLCETDTLGYGKLVVTIANNS